jgi:hypothetical protein
MKRERASEASFEAHLRTRHVLYDRVPSTFSLDSSITPTLHAASSKI